jgi:hypothetical protein
MRTLISFISISLIFILSCKNQTESIKNEGIPSKYMITDTSNWIEITDTINIDFRCIDWQQIQYGAILNSEIEYKTYFDSSVISKTLPKDTMYNHWGDCTQYISSNFDFTNRSVLGFAIITGFAKTKRQIFINDQSKKYLYLLSINRINNDEIGIGYYKWVSIPKVKEGYSVIFDTTSYNNN